MIKFFQKKKDSIDKNRVVILVALVVVLTIYIFTNTMGNKEPAVAVNAQQIVISGMYGTTIDMQNVRSVYVMDTFPQKLRKTNGYDNFGNTKLGQFEVDGITTTVFIFSKSPPCLYISTTDKNYMIDFKDGQKTQDLYQEIMNIWKK